MLSEMKSNETYFNGFKGAIRLLFPWFSNTLQELLFALHLNMNINLHITNQTQAYRLNTDL